VRTDDLLLSKAHVSIIVAHGLQMAGVDVSGRKPAASGAPSFAPWPAFDDKGDADSDDTLNDSSLAQWNIEQYGVSDVSSLSDEQLNTLRANRAKEQTSVR
jgi:hypothetical protein